jgi:hypothetical protein
MSRILMPSVMRKWRYSKELTGCRLKFSTTKVEDIKKSNNLKDVHDVDDDLTEYEEMFVEGPKGLEWGGPTRGGARPEPTRYGDWERKG